MRGECNERLSSVLVETLGFVFLLCAVKAFGAIMIRRFVVLKLDKLG
jgi:hypothetical protein